MTKPEFDDETLVAFADGELDDGTTSRLEAALEMDEELAARLAVFLDSRIAVASALKPLIREPVPDALAATVRRMADEAKKPTPENNIVPLRPRRTGSVARPWLLPVAASLVAVLAGIGGFMLGREIGPAVTSSEAVLAKFLDEQPSGHDMLFGASGETLHAVSSFRDEHGDLCREYELKRPGTSAVTIACREDGAWITRLALSAPHAEGYTPASAQETVDAYLASINAGAPLTADEERAALAALR